MDARRRGVAGAGTMHRAPTQSVPTQNADTQRPYAERRHTASLRRAPIHSVPTQSAHTHSVPTQSADKTLLGNCRDLKCDGEGAGGEGQVLNGMPQSPLTPDFVPPLSHASG